MASNMSSSSQQNGHSLLPQTVSEKYLQERVFWNIIAQLNPNGILSTDILTTDLPYFVYNPLLNYEEKLPTQQQHQSERKSSSSERQRKPSSAVSSSRRAESKQSYRGAKGSARQEEKQPNSPTSELMSIEEQIELDIEREMKRILNIDDQVKRENMLSERSISPILPSDSFRQSQLFKPNRSGSVRSSIRKSKRSKDEFVFTNPNNVYIPTEYDDILFDDDDDDYLLPQKKSDLSPTTGTSTLQNIKSKYRLIYEVNKPKPPQVKSESKDNMKKILLKQFELTSALHSQLNELNKKKVKRRPR